MLLTKWGEALDRELPLPEYPRPQLKRESFLNLNGVWSCAFTQSSAPPEEFFAHPKNPRLQEFLSKVL